MPRGVDTKTYGLTTAAMIFILPAHFWQVSMSISKTRFRSFAPTDISLLQAQAYLKEFFVLQIRNKSVN